MQPSRVLTWRCDLCREPIEDGAGHLALDEDALGSYQLAMRREQQKTEERSGLAGAEEWSAADLANLPIAPRWEIRHHGCDPAPDALGYHFDVADVRTERDLIAKTAHLMGYPWLADTNWDDMLRGVADGGMV